MVGRKSVQAVASVPVLSPTSRTTGQLAQQEKLEGEETTATRDPVRITRTHEGQLEPMSVSHHL